MPKFNIESAGDSKPRMEQRWIWLNQIEPDEFNKEIYSVTGIEALAEDIRLNGLLQFPLVRYMPGGKYMIISGHRRVQAIRLLAREAPEEWKTIPVILDPEQDETAAHIKLISANAVNRELSQWEIMQQTLKMHELLTEQKEKDGLPGRVRDMVAKKLNMSTGAVGEYLAINGNLIEQLKEKFKEGAISKALAVELSRISEARQFECYDAIGRGITLTAREVRELFQTSPNREGDAGSVSESDTSARGDEHTERYNVPKSDTQGKPQRWTLRSGYVALPDEERVKFLKNGDMYGATHVPPCQNCKLATNCSGCCNVCQNKCGMRQDCHKLAKTEEKNNEELKEMPNINIYGDAEEERVECRQQDDQEATEAGGPTERQPGGESPSRSEVADVSDSDTQENVSHDLAWYQDMIRVAVVDVAIACQKIHKLGGDCASCPLCVDDWCTLTDHTPKHHQYMLEARRHDAKIDELFMEQDW